MLTTTIESKLNSDTILISNGLIRIPDNKDKKGLSNNVIGTIISNLLSYGYILSTDTLKQLSKVSYSSIQDWWYEIDKTLGEITGANRKMEDFVVYKNFPEEVLSKTDAEYWIAQIFMYWGAPNDLFTEEVKERKPMLENIKLKVLKLANSNSLQQILNSLAELPSRWTRDQKDWVIYLLNDNKTINPSKIPFKENMATVVVFSIESGINIKISSATDILRIAIALSDGDLTGKTNTKFKSLSRPIRRYLLKQLDSSSNLQEDIARDPERWKRFLYALHPREFTQKKGYTYPKVAQASNNLYKDKVESFNSNVEELLSDENIKVLQLLSSRPGDFVRRLRHTIEIFKGDAVKAFIKVIPELKVIQLLKLSKYLDTVNSRTFRTIAPKGNWTKLQVIPNNHKINQKFINDIQHVIKKILSNRIKNKINLGVLLDEKTQFIKIQTNDSDLSPYGRGTVFPIPDNITFLRSASYWKQNSYGNTWFDNGWNLFDENWNSQGACSWTSPLRIKEGAIFSGDPTNSKEMKGRGCQMIDLYIDKLVEKGVRYGVWNILCFSRIAFNKAEDVFAALQWGENPETGKLFEASRCQLMFPVKGETFAKYIAYVDFVKRQIIYMDANLKANVRSADSNCVNLSKVMPAFVEYLDTLPSIHDLFKPVESKKKNSIPILYSDLDTRLSNPKELAYVFKQENAENKYTKLDINSLLA